MPSNHLILCCPLLLLPSIFPSIRVFQMSQLFSSGGQSIGASASTSVLPMNTQVWSPLGWTGWISLQSKGLSRVFSNTTVQKHQFFGTQLSSQSSSTSIPDHWKNHSLDWTDFCWQSKCLLFNILSRLVNQKNFFTLRAVKMLSITSLREMQIKINEIPFHTIINLGWLWFFF